MNTTDTQPITNPARVHPGDFVRVMYTDGNSFVGVIRPVEVLPGKVDLYVVSKDGGFTPLQVAKDVSTREPEWNSHVVTPVERMPGSVGSEPGVLDSPRDLRDGMRLAVRVLGHTLYGTVATDEAGVVWLQKDTGLPSVILRIDDYPDEWSSAIHRAQVISPTTHYQKESTTMSTTDTDTDTAVATSPGPLPADGEYTLHGPMKPHNAVVQYRRLLIEADGYRDSGTYSVDVTPTWNRDHLVGPRWYLTPGNNNTTTEKESTTMSTTDTETTLTPSEIKPGQRIRITYGEGEGLPPAEVTVGLKSNGRLVGVVDGHDVEDGASKVIFPFDGIGTFSPIIESVTLLHQPEEKSAAELRSVIDGKDELIRSLEERVKSANEGASAASVRHQQDIATIGAALREEAENRDWCNEYDEVVDNINGDLYVELPIRARRVSFTVTRTWTVTATCTGSPGQADDEGFIQSSITVTDDDVEMDSDWEDVESYEEDTTVTEVSRA